MDAETAQWVAAEQVIARKIAPPGDEFSIAGVERFGTTWVVYWNTRRFIETGDRRYAVAGNGPVMVGDDWRVAQAGSALPVEHYVAEFEREQSSGDS